MESLSLSPQTEGSLGLRTRTASDASDYNDPYIETDIDHTYVRALSELSIGESVSPRASLYRLLPEILESIFIYLPVPRRVAGVCRLFRAIVVTSKSFKRSWIRYWLHPELPKSFMPSYSQLCQAIDTKTPFNILMEIIDLQVLGRRRLQSSHDGSVVKLFDKAYEHPTSEKLIPYLINRGVQIDKYISHYSLRDCKLTDNGLNPEKKSENDDYLSLARLAAHKSFDLRQELANKPNFVSDTELAFSVVLHERLDVATAIAIHPQHIFDILEESVDKQYTKGIGWAFAHGVGETQKRNPLYLRLCIEKADVEAAKLAIKNGAEINMSPSSSHKDEPAKFGSTSLLEFTIQCYLAYNEQKEARWQLIVLFLKSGADANADDGRPLCLCVTNNHNELTRLLLDYGADPRLNNMLAVKIATDFGYKDMAKQLYELSKNNASKHRRQASTSSNKELRVHFPNDDEQGNDKNGGKKSLVRRLTLSMPKVSLVSKRRRSEGDKTRRPSEN